MVSTVGLIVVLFVFSIGRRDPPRSVVALDFLLGLAFVAGARFAVRALVERPSRGPLLERAANEVLIVGAGNGGQQVAFELRRNPGCTARLVGFVDDDPRKRGCAWPAQGARLGPTSCADPRRRAAVGGDHRDPSAPGTLRAKVVTCRERGIPVRTLPTTFEMLSGGVNLMRQVREVRVEDVLGREPVRVEVDRIGAYLRGRTVLVTGAGGLIGAELSRQIAQVGPNGSCSSRTRRTRCSRSAASSRRSATSPGRRPCSRTARTPPDARGLRRAAPVGGVPRGGLQARTADGGEPRGGGAQQRGGHAHRGGGGGEAGAERFVLVSTDKAVSPATVMGASKALAEWAVEAAQNRWKGTRYSSVRFGNVLGSSGSVVPIFRARSRRAGRSRSPTRG